MSEDSIADGPGNVGKVDSKELLLMSAANLRKGIEYAIRQLNAKRVRSEVKLRWMKSLTKQTEALVKVVEALNNMGARSAKSSDLASFLSSVESRIASPVREARTMRDAVSEFRDVVRQASLSEGGVGSVGRRRSCRSR
jgi:hypothetical protein